MARRPAMFANAYRLTKLVGAVDEFVAEVVSAGRSKGNSSLAQAFSSAYRKAQEGFSRPLTQQIYLTGAAMAPTLNKAALQDPDALERLVVRLIKRPSSRNVLVGDVVAFYSPLAQADSQHVMVRRVAAVEGEEMVSSSDEEKSFRIPDAHCWVLADNEALKPSDVIDSRSFGHIPFSSVLGRVIYAATSKHDHTPVPNNPESVVADAPVVEAEVDLDAMFPEPEQGEGQGKGAEDQKASKGDKQQ